LHHDATAGDRDAPGGFLAADVDHVRLTGRVEMGKMGASRLPGRRRIPRGSVAGRRPGFPA
jgi:hypothetical protein